MMAFDLVSDCAVVMDKLKGESRLSKYITSDPLPQPFRGSGPIRLIVIGQDPTIQDAAKRKQITTVLNLNKSGSAYVYIAQISNRLGLDLKQNVYATNIYKNFFVAPPTGIDEIDIFGEFAKYWHPLLKEELQEFPNVPIVSLGEPVLGQLIRPGINAKVRYYWGYQPGWQKRDSLPSPLAYVKAADTWLESPLFPYPHIPSLRKQFYRRHLDHYSAYMKQVAFPGSDSVAAMPQV